jgi:hypothetical protein
VADSLTLSCPTMITSSTQFFICANKIASPAIKVQQLEQPQNNAQVEAKQSTILQMKREVSLGQNMQAASRAIAEVAKVRKSSNAKSHEGGWSKDKEQELLTKLRSRIEGYAKNIRSNSPNLTMDQAYTAACFELYPTLEYGMCSEEARYAFALLEKEGVRPLTLAYTTVGQHQLFVIGEGDEAVVCDVWAEKKYPLSKFAEMQKPEHDVEYSDGYRRYFIKDFGKYPPPYLAGDLRSTYSIK